MQRFSQCILSFADRLCLDLLNKLGTNTWRSLARPLLLVSVSCGAALASHAQTAHFSAAQSTITTNLYQPWGIAADASGNIYIADEGNSRVLKETLTPGGYVESTFVSPESSGASYFLPYGVAVDRSGDVFILNGGDGTVLKETPAAGGHVQSVIPRPSVEGGPLGIATGLGGDLFLGMSYSDGKVVKLMPLGASYVQTEIAGGLGPFEIAVAADRQGNVYVISLGQGLFKETPSGDTYTQSLIATQFMDPYGVAADSSGNVFVVDLAAGAVWKETPSAGGYTQSELASDGLSQPDAIAIDGNGILVTDSDNDRVVELRTDGGKFPAVRVGRSSAKPVSAIFTFDTGGTLGSTRVVTGGVQGLDFTDAGTGSCKAGATYNAGDTCTVDVRFSPRYAGTRDGAAELLDAAGNVMATGYFEGTGLAPQMNFPPGTQTTIAEHGMLFPTGVTINASGDLYVADTGNNRILKETPSGATYAQSTVRTGDLSAPFGIALDGAGNLYVADTGNNRIVKETLTGSRLVQSTVPSSSLNYPLSVAVDGSGNLYIADTGNRRVLKETLSNGRYTESLVQVGHVPRSVVVDGSGNVYIADFGDGGVWKEAPAAGTYSESSVARIPGGVNQLALDGGGNVYIVTASGVLEAKPSGTTYTLSTVAGGLIEPQGAVVDPSGNVFIVDSLNGRVLKEDFADPPSVNFATTFVGFASNPETITMENVGNLPLVFPIPSTGTNPSVRGDFLLDNSGESTCPLVSAGSSSPGILAPGAGCTLSMRFTPSKSGDLTGTLSVTDNVFNTVPPAYTTQNIRPSGKALGGGRSH